MIQVTINDLGEPSVRVGYQVVEAVSVSYEWEEDGYKVLVVQYRNDDGELMTTKVQSKVKEPGTVWRDFTEGK